MLTTTSKDISNKKLSAQVYELLKHDILECAWEPGQLLEETEVSDRYQIGRTPFREACPRLEAEGLIEIVPHRGVFVASLSTKDIIDLFELRLVVEPTIAEMACVRRQPGDLKGLEVNLKDCARLSRSKRAQVIPELNWNSQDFHVQVARLARNVELIEVVERIHNKLMRILVFAARRSPDDYPFNAIHAEIFDAIVRGKGGEARKLMVRDIEQAQQWVKDFGS
jgi:DNA-binding GntR family transcriptional regulator